VDGPGRRREILLELRKLEDRPAIAPIATGFARLDEALGGGLPRGCIIELYGPSSCGKTSVALQIAAETQRAGGLVAWIDAERAFNPDYAAESGVAIERLVVVQPESAEQALAIAYRLASSAAVDLLIVDSAAALVPELELQTEIGVQSEGLHARVMASGLRRLDFALRRFRAAALFVNQTRMFHLPDGPAERAAGGAPLKLYAAVRIALTLGASGRSGFRIVKSRVTKTFSEGDLTAAETRELAKTP
jgi:recombination protein RecA